MPIVLRRASRPIQTRLPSRTTAMRPMRTAAALLALPFLMGACGPDASTDPSAEEDSSAIRVSVANIAYEPATLTIEVGDEVTWLSEDQGVAHTVTSGQPAGETVPGVSEGAASEPDGVFDGDLPDAGSAFSFTFDKAGTFAYFCEVHPSMTAEITVE